MYPLEESHGMPTEMHSYQVDKVDFVPVRLIHDKLDGFVKIPDKAADTPARFIRDAVFRENDNTDRHDCISPASIHEMKLAKEYAIQKVEITRTNETE